MMKRNIQPLTWVEIDLGALSYNLGQIRRKVKGAGILAVVKSDAYGHGAKEAARQLSKEKVELLGVSTIAEAQDLRKAGIKLPIAILSGILPDQIEAAIDCQAIPTVSDWKLARVLNQAAKRRKKKIKIQVKVDTGMGRLGIWYQDAFSVVKKIKEKLPFLSLQGIFTHFATADEKDKSFTRLQLRRFQNVLSRFKEAKIDIPWRHIANSAAILDIPESYSNGVNPVRGKTPEASDDGCLRQPISNGVNMVRPGLILYGAYPSREVSRSISLKPVMSLKSRIIALKKISRGESVSYGRTWRAKRDITAGILPIGYALGYSRFLSNCGKVIVKSEKVPVIGRVCMDMSLIDMGVQSKAKVGDEIILIGRKKDLMIKVEDLAQTIGTIPYEILCLIGMSVDRIYRKKK